MAIEKNGGLQAKLWSRMGFPSGVVKGKSPAEALEYYRTQGVTSPEIHLTGPDDPLLQAGRAWFADASIHLPSPLDIPEDAVLEHAEAAVAAGYDRLITHPNVIRTPERWRQLGSKILVENLDFRYPGHAHAADLRGIFELLPEARFCLDVGHAYACDPDEAERLIEVFADRLAQVHYSEVLPVTGDHRTTVSEDVLRSHARHLQMIACEVPLILEVSPASEEELRAVRERVLNSLAR